MALFHIVLVLFFIVLILFYNYTPLSGALPDDSADVAPSEAELYEDLEFGDQSPIDYYEDEEMSEGDIADD